MLLDAIANELEPTETSVSAWYKLGGMFEMGNIMRWTRFAAYIVPIACGIAIGGGCAKKNDAGDAVPGNRTQDVIRCEIHKVTCEPLAFEVILKSEIAEKIRFSMWDLERVFSRTEMVDPLGNNLEIKLVKNIYIEPPPLKTDYEQTLDAHESKALRIQFNKKVEVYKLLRESDGKAIECPKMESPLEITYNLIGEIGVTDNRFGQYRRAVVSGKGVALLR